MMRFFITAWIVCVSISTAQSAAPIPTKTAEEKLTPAMKAKKALAKTISCKAVNRTGSDVLELFRGLAQVEIEFDSKALTAQGIDLQSPIYDFEFKNITLEAAITKAFAKLNMTVGVVATGLVIAPADQLLAKQFRQKTTIDLKEVPLNEYLTRIEDTYGVSVVLDPRLLNTEKPISLKMPKVTVELAVRMAADMAGLDAVRLENILFVTTDDRAVRLQKMAAQLVPEPQTFDFINGGFFDPLLNIPPGGGANPFQVFPIPPIGDPPIPPGGVDLPPPSNPRR